MLFLMSLIIAIGFATVVCLVLVKLTWDLSQMSAHEAPESYESSPAELSDTR